MLRIKDREIGPGQRPYLIAELSGNHNHSMDRAMDIVRAAAASGADAIKLQTYTADGMTLDVSLPDFIIDDPKSPWAGRRLHDLYEEAHTPWEWHEPLMKAAAELGMHCFSSPFDLDGVAFLETLDVPAYKIASFEIVDHELIHAAASTGKPIILSTGMSTLAEISDAVDVVRGAGNEQFALLKCTSSYPAPPDRANLRTIPHLRDAFNCVAGLSDHTLGCGIAVAGVTLGAAIVEKHMTMARADGGVDAAFSMEPQEFTQLREEIDRAAVGGGDVSYGCSDVEKGSIMFRRSLYISQDVEAGELLTRKNLRSIRPGFGLPPKYIKNLLGQRVTRRVERGTPASWELLRPVGESPDE